MIRFWEENKNLILALVAALAFVGFVRLAVAGPANGRAHETERKLQAIKKKLKEHSEPKVPRLTEAGGAPSTQPFGLRSG